MSRNYKNVTILKSLDEMYMKGDPLSFLVTPVHFNKRSHIFAHNIIKGLVVLFLETFNVIGIIHIWRDETGTYMLQYISIILAQQIGITSLVLHIYNTKEVFGFPELIQKFFLPLSAIGGKVHQSLLHECSLIRKQFLLVFIVTTLSMCNMLPLIVGRDAQFTVVFIKKHFHVWSTLFQGIYYFCLITIGYSLSCLCTCCIYITTHLKFQFHLLSQYLTHMVDDMERDSEGNFCQIVISQRLRSFIRTHNKIKTATALLLDFTKWPLLVSAVSCVLSYTAFGYFMVSDVSPWKYIRCTIGVVIAGIVSVIIIRTGQNMQDETANLYNAACHCEWRNWNLVNRKILLMIIMNTSREVTITSFGLMDLGHKILLQVLKVSYSMVLLFTNLKKINCLHIDNV